MFAVDRDSIRSGSENTVLDTASAMISSFSPADAVGVIGLPVGGIDPTRDHAAAADAIRMMTGTRPVVNWRFRLTWREAIELANGNKEEIFLVHERECTAFNSVFSPSNRDCSRQLTSQVREMVAMGRGHAQTVLTRLSAVLDNLSTVRAPKHLVLFSGGIAFDVDLLSRYRDLAHKAAQARVTIFVVHLDQPAYDASDRMIENVFNGSEFTTGLGNIASSSGGVFIEAVGTAAGALNRVTSYINAFYQLGVEVQPRDADVRTLRVKVDVTRPKVTIRAPSQIAVAPARRSPSSPSADAVTNALAHATDVAEVPFEVATYVTHAAEAGKVRVIVAATAPDASGFVPAEWGYQVLDGGTVVGGSRDRIASTERWLETASLVVPVGKYRIRAAVVASDGRIARLDLPLDAGLRAAGAVKASDLIVGLATSGRVEPRARLTQGDPGVALLELSSTEPLTGTTGAIELTRAGTAQPVIRRPFELRAQARNEAVVAGQASFDLSGLPPGTYMASAVLDRDGQPFARISRLVELVPGETTAALTRPESTTAPALMAGTVRDLALEEVLPRVGRYVASYGEQASLIVGVERYEQRYQNAPAGERAQRRLVAELALFKTNDATGWVGFRDVVAVDGKPIPDRQNRLVALLRSSMPDVAEARRIADESARFNIGPTRRNFNEPTVALFFLLPVNQSRFTFTRKGMMTVDGTMAMEIAFQETGRPTVIRTSDGRDAASTGTIWVVPADGTVLRTRLTVAGFAGPASIASIDVTFAREPRLKLWLPAKMTERHEAPTDPAILARRKRPPTVPSIGSTTSTAVAPDEVAGKGPSVVTGTATYSEFKRFETGVSISVK